MKALCTNNNKGGKILVIDATLDPDKVDACSNMGRLHDLSHVRALALTELKNIMTIKK